MQTNIFPCTFRAGWPHSVVTSTSRRLLHESAQCLELASKPVSGAGPVRGQLRPVLGQKHSHGGRPSRSARGPRRAFFARWGGVGRPARGHPRSGFETSSTDAPPRAGANEATTKVRWNVCRRSSPGCAEDHRRILSPLPIDGAITATEAATGAQARWRIMRLSSDGQTGNVGRDRS
jgi:hypothetical protein